MSDTADTGPEPVLRATGIHIAYGGEPVLDDVSLDLRAGHCLALAGANGSGKSTLLRVCVGRQQADEGEVFFAGRPPREADAAFRRDVALLLDGAECFPDLTVGEHIRMVATAHGMGKDAGPATERVLAQLGLDHRIDAFPDALSAGQRQMLVLTSVLVRPARLIVVDEPEQRLDTAARHRLATALRQPRRTALRSCWRRTTGRPWRRPPTGYCSWTGDASRPSARLPK
ncbi:ATP-binding cassette domain-containing protein [Streptomyces sp. NPDC059564]|uniref:ABC transporter ATP-binding protein n=1 Tax=Streptomyces sp. NPDC059564 TaxID=3346865 RepID=UPI00368FAD32